jgi:hypothetical protein
MVEETVEERLYRTQLDQLAKDFNDGLVGINVAREFLGLSPIPEEEAKRLDDERRAHMLWRAAVASALFGR